MLKTHRLFKSILELVGRETLSTKGGGGVERDLVNDRVEAKHLADNSTSSFKNELKNLKTSRKKGGVTTAENYAKRFSSNLC